MVWNRRQWYLQIQRNNIYRIYNQINSTTENEQPLTGRFDAMAGRRINSQLFVRYPASVSADE